MAPCGDDERLRAAFPVGDFNTVAVGHLARRLGITPRQVALPWLLARAPDILLISGMSSLDVPARVGTARRLASLTSFA